MCQDQHRDIGTSEMNSLMMVGDGLLLKVLRLVIPNELQEEYLHNLHEGHLSALKVQENA